MTKVVAALVGAEALQTFTEEQPEGLDGPIAGGADDRFQLREAELDGIEVGTVGREIPERGVGALDRAADAGDLVQRTFAPAHTRVVTAVSRRHPFQLPGRRRAVN